MIGRPEASATAEILVALPRFVLSTAKLFLPGRTAVDERFADINATEFKKGLRSAHDRWLKIPLLHTILKAAVARLILRIALGNFLP